MNFISQFLVNLATDEVAPNWPDSFKLDSHPSILAGKYHLGVFSPV
jgi:hypothetical protein